MPIYVLVYGICVLLFTYKIFKSFYIWGKKKQKQKKNLFCLWHNFYGTIFSVYRIWEPPTPCRAPVLPCEPLRTRSSFLDGSIPWNIYHAPTPNPLPLTVPLYLRVNRCIAGPLSLIAVRYHETMPHPTTSPLTGPLYLHVNHCIPCPLSLMEVYRKTMHSPAPNRAPVLVLTCDPLHTKSSFFDGSIPMQWCPHPHPLTGPLYLHVIHCVPSPLSLMAVYPCNDAPTPLQSPCTYMWSTAYQVLFLWWQYTHAMMPPPPYRAPVLTCDPLRTKSSFFDGSIPMQWCPHPVTEPLYLHVIHCVPSPLSLMAVYPCNDAPTPLQSPCTYMWSTAYQVLFLWWQ